MMNKKKISIILAACMTLTVFGQAGAYAKPAQNKRQSTVKEKSVSESKLVEVTEDNLDDLIVTATMDWLNIVQPDISFCVGDILEVNVDGSDEVQYMASLFNKTIPYGYVVVGFRNNEPVVMESNVTKGQESLYTEIVEDIVDNSKMKRKDLDIKKKVVGLAPMQYAVEYEDKQGKKKVLDNYGEELDTDKLAYGSTIYNDGTSIHIWNTEWTKDKYKVVDKLTLKKYNSNPQLFDKEWTKDLTGKYACGVQSLLQIAYMEHLTTYSESDIKKTYNKLWDYTNTTKKEEPKDKTGSDDNILYGEGVTEDAGRGFVKFAKEKGYTNTEFKGVKDNPSVAWIKDKLEYNRPILLGYGITVKDEENEGKTKRFGHFVSVLAYVRAQKLSSGNTWNYLMVYNGWTNTVSYINYSCVDFTDCDATYFWVKK